jgi:hypothetical protein
VLAEERTGIEQLLARRPQLGDERRRRSPTRWWPSAGCSSSCSRATWPAGSRGSSTTSSSPPTPASTSRTSSSGCARRWPRPTSTRCPRPCPTPIPSSWPTCRCFDALNRMIEQREDGEPIDPSFESSWSRFGDFCSRATRPDLDELLEQLAAQMAAVQAMWNSMSPEQRSQLQGLADSCSRTSTCAGRWTGWPATCSRRSPGPDGTSGTGSVATIPWGWPREPTPPAASGPGRARADFLRSASSPASLAEVDLDKVPSTWATTPPARSTAWPAGQAAGGRRAHRSTGGSLRAHAQGHPPDRPAGAVRPVLSWPRTDSATTAPPWWGPATTRGDHQALRVR